MTEDVKIDNELLMKLGKELMEDIHVNLMNVRDKSMLVSTIRTKWVMKFFREKEQLVKLKAAKEKMIKKGVSELHISDSTSRTMSKLRIEEKVESEDATIKRLNSLISKQSEVLQFMEYALNIVADFNFTVKHALDAIKLEQS